MTDIEDMRIGPVEFPKINEKYSEDIVSKIDKVIHALNEDPTFDICKLLRQNKLSIQHIILLHRYNQLVSENKIEPNQELEFKLIKKKGKGHSGIENISVVTRPEGKFVGCPADCHYCPKEPEKYFEVKVVNVKLDNDKLVMEIKPLNDEDIHFSKVINKIYYQEKEIEVINSHSYGREIILYFQKNQFDEYPKEDDVIQAYKTAQPRSYVTGEPAIDRANQNGWDCVAQFRDIAIKRIMCGHQITKVEGIVIGGTWSFYPKDYQESFIRDFYYAANTLYDSFINNKLREKKSLEDEIEINQTTTCRVIGLTLETRPDFITPTEIKLFRRYGCTRIQLGVQHIDDEILNKINRNCPTWKTIKAIKLLKNAGFKVDIHLMPDLPFSSFKKDYNMFETVLKSPEFQADQWKIYPCQTMKYTKIKEWYEKGDYKPYYEKKKTIYYDNIITDNKYKDLTCLPLSIMIPIYALGEISVRTFLTLNPDYLNYLFIVPAVEVLGNFVNFYIHKEFRFMNLIKPLGLVGLISSYIYHPPLYKYTFLVSLFRIYNMIRLYRNGKKMKTNRLFHLLVDLIPKVHPWIRLNRIIRDNPKDKIVGGVDKPHYRNEIEKRLDETGNKSQDIREREIKNRQYNPDKVILYIREYMASDGKELFISFEDYENNYLLGFARLRIPKKDDGHYLPELRNASLLRELHVYGWMVPQNGDGKMVQHQGFGQKLVKFAEDLSLYYGYNKMAIIAGVGVREYYEKKLGYKLEGTYMTKEFYGSGKSPGALTWKYGSLRSYYELSCSKNRVKKENVVTL